MPLYVNDEAILAQFPDIRIVHALQQIKDQTSATAVTPALAQQLIRRYLQPLASTEDQIIFEKKRNASWDSIFFLYVDIGFCSEHNDNLWQVACAVKLLHAHTVQPPRDLVFAPIEVNTFFQLCNYLHLPMQSVRYPNGNKDLDPLRFCVLCWRQPLPGRQLCGHHTPSGPERLEDDARSASARYKAGIRQKELFEKTINRILTRETIEFHESSFQAQTLLPEHGIALWLADRRPAVWRELCRYKYDFTDENAIRSLLDYLHSPYGLTNKAKVLYRAINEHIELHPALIWPMLIRAEGWYQSRDLKEKNWGGHRAGSGRPELAK